MDYSTIPTDNPDYWAYLGVDSQEAMEAILLQIDLDNDGFYNYDEISRHFVLDSDWLCAGGPEGRVFWDKNITIIQPNYKKPTPFEKFWLQFDDDHMNQDMTEIEMANWISASAGVTLFEDMSQAEILAEFDVHDLNGDGAVTIDEAYQVFTHPETVEEVSQRV